MNKVVRENYPVSKLPHDLQQGWGERARVTVTIETDLSPESASRDEPSTGGESLLDRGRRVRTANYSSLEEVNAYVRSLRD